MFRRMKHTCTLPARKVVQGQHKRYLNRMDITTNCTYRYEQRYMKENAAGSIFGNGKSQETVYIFVIRERGKIITHPHNEILYSHYETNVDLYTDMGSSSR